MSAQQVADEIRAELARAERDALTYGQRYGARALAVAEREAERAGEDEAGYYVHLLEQIEARS